MNLPALWLFALLLFVLPALPTFPQHGIGGMAEAGKFFSAGVLAIVGGAWVLRRVPPNAARIAIGLLLVYVFLLLFSLLVDVERVIARDALELYKPPVVVGSFLFGAGIAFADRRAVPVVWRGLTALLLSVFILGVIEVLRPDFAGIPAFYKRDSAVLFRRPITFFSTTYFAASVYLLLGSMFTARAIMSRRTVANLLLAFAAFALVLLTQSRAAVLALLVVLAWAGILLSVLSLSDRWTTLVRLVAVVVVAVGVGAYAVSYALENLDYLTTGIQRYVLNWDQNLTGTGSLAARAGQVTWALEENRLVLLGSGVGKAYNPLLESWYALYYYRYGLAGILAYVGVWGGFWAYSLARIRRVRHTLGRDAASVVAGLNIFLVGLPIISLSSVITDQIFMIPIYYGLLGVGVGLIATANAAVRDEDVPDAGLPGDARAHGEATVG